MTSQPVRAKDEKREIRRQAFGPPSLHHNPVRACQVHDSPASVKLSPGKGGLPLKA